MPPKFGTSGLRGLVTDLTSALVGDYTRAFIAACPIGSGLYVGMDLRPSSPRIAQDVISAARQAGINVTDCGALPTPALALASMGANAAAIMITGSHIPADRNGLKFYSPSGEISKSDEVAIGAAYQTGAASGAVSGTVSSGTLSQNSQATTQYLDRYIQAFGARALHGLRLGVYQHSSVARDLLTTLVEALGATAIPLARSNDFIPVDTEAVDPATRERLGTWAAEHRLDAILSTDGDADRPMLTDATGQVIPGDILGVITAQTLGAKVICAPVSSNSMLQSLPDFEQRHLTKIGSPFVIAAMEAALAANPAAQVVGFEPNGGFLLGFQALGTLCPLMTRDAVLPMIAPLVQAHAIGLAALIAQLPPRFTATDRLENIPTQESDAFLANLAADPDALTAFFAPTGPVVATNRTDGLRLSFAGEMQAIVHLRPSGNAPEFRVYAEANTRAAAQDLLKLYLARVREAIEFQSFTHLKL